MLCHTLVSICYKHPSMPDPHETGISSAIPAWFFLAQPVMTHAYDLGSSGFNLLYASEEVSIRGT